MKSYSKAATEAVRAYRRAKNGQKTNAKQIERLLYDLRDDARKLSARNGGSKQEVYGLIKKFRAVTIQTQTLLPTERFGGGRGWPEVVTRTLSDGINNAMQMLSMNKPSIAAGNLEVYAQSALTELEPFMPRVRNPNRRP